MCSECDGSECENADCKNYSGMSLKYVNPCRHYESFTCGFCKGSQLKQETCPIIHGPKIKPRNKLNTGWNDAAKQMANEHWQYIQALLTTHGIEQVEIDIIGFHYVSSFEHGFKHAIEYLEG